MQHPAEVAAVAKVLLQTLILLKTIEEDLVSPTQWLENKPQFLGREGNTPQPPSRVSHASQCLLT